ncbi:MAG TPA: DUF389 domain-containing protein [Tepidisphaeraceae bacterium]|nr:DUF389 domain-containing protein [Tepidisphaeraceae bacterium]
MLIHVPRGDGPKVLDAAKKHNAVNVAALAALGQDGDEQDLVVLQVPNERIEGLMDDLQRLPHPRITLAPWGVITLRPPEREAAEQATDVSQLSPIEVFLGGLQSVGSWKGMIGYAAAAGVVVWIGLYTNRIYLLTAAMLIAPFAGPAMNLALATARGDRELSLRALARYVASLAITILITFLLSLALRQDIATEQMVSASLLSSTAVLLPLVAGAAGALNLCQSERDSLVSGAATGMLVAASLAPPAGLIGMASALGEWDMVISGVYVLVLQLVGINISGALVFRIFGLSPRGVRYDRGRPWLAWTTWGSSLVIVAGLLTFQLWETPYFQRSTRAQRAAAEVKRVVNSSGIAKLIEVNARFTRADIPGQNTLLVVVYAQPSGNGPASEQDIEQRLRQAVKDRLLARGFNVAPRVQVNVVE